VYSGLVSDTAFVGSGGAYALFHRSEYFNLSCHCLSHSSRDCIGSGDHQIPQRQAGRSPGKQRQEEEQKIEDYDE